MTWGEIMMEDIRYSEMLFLQAVLNKKLDLIHPSTIDSLNSFKISPEFFLGMVETLLEDMYLSFDHPPHQELVLRLRREHVTERPFDISEQDWIKPRTGIRNILQGKTMYKLRITYRGVRRIEELRDILRRDRILDDFGVLLSMRYFDRDLQDALGRSPDLSISVIHADMDNFGQFNKDFGHDAGNEVMKAYLLAVRDAVGLLGTAYRVGGDETASIIVGQGRQRAHEIANGICAQVRSLRVEYNGQILPNVTASVGVATSPPAPRSHDVHTMAEAAQRKAKAGKDRVVEG
jgi:diguanylate cyclase (GGDEF)-like protein